MGLIKSKQNFWEPKCSVHASQDNTLPADFEKKAAGEGKVKIKEKVHKEPSRLPGKARVGFLNSVLQNVHQKVRWQKEIPGEAAPNSSFPIGHCAREYSEGVSVTLSVCPAHG